MDPDILFQRYIRGCGDVVVMDTLFRGERVRLLTVDGAMQSVTYNEPERREQLIFEYMKEFDMAQRLRPDATKTLLLGGGGFSYPKHFLKEYPERHIDIVEICPELVEIAKEYFYFDGTSKQCEIHIGDATDFLRQTSEHFDVILNDLYIGPKWDKKMSAKEHCRLIKDHLSEDGIYALNIVTAQRGPFAHRGRRLMKNLRECFAKTLLIPCQDETDLWSRQNCLVFATDGNL